MRRIIFALCLLTLPTFAHADAASIAYAISIIAQAAPYVAVVMAAVAPYGKRSKQRGAREPSEHVASHGERTAASLEEPACHS